MSEFYKISNKKTNNENHIGTQMDQFSMKYEIIINAQKKFWDNETISYEELCDMVFSKFIAAATIQYSLGPAHCIQGTLTSGQSADIQDGMVFVVAITNNA